MEERKSDAKSARANSAVGRADKSGARQRSGAGRSGSGRDAGSKVGRSAGAGTGRGAGRGASAEVDRGTSGGAGRRSARPSRGGAGQRSGAGRGFNANAGVGKGRNGRGGVSSVASAKSRSVHQNPTAAPIDRPKLERPNLPLDADIDLQELPVGVRAELRGLRPDAAEEVGNYLVMAGRLVAQDPEAALPYAQAVKNRASRLPVAREALAEVAYAAQRFDIALSEFRALRRMTGNPEYLPVLADCERAVGRVPAAIRLIKEGLAEVQSATIRIELHLVESGIRYDQGQVKEALRVLKEAIAETGKRGSKIARARLRYAYADLLLELGHRELAEKWFSTAAGLDEFGETDAEARLAELSGVEILTADLVADEEE